MKLSIVIPVFNNCEFTRSALQDLSLLSLPSGSGLEKPEIIVVDNGSIDKTTQVVSEFNGVIYQKNAENKGFSHACNQGYNLSSGEYVMFLNNDIKVLDRQQDWPLILIEACEQGLAGVHSGMIDSKYRFQKEGRFDPNQKGAYLSGWCLCAKRETWEKIAISPGQIWDERFFLYFEDGDLSFRAKKDHIPLIRKDIPVKHIARATGKKYNMFHFLNKSKRVFKKKWPEIW